MIKPDTPEKRLRPTGEMVKESLRAGIRTELRIHKALNNSIVIWRDGKIVEIPPEEIQIDELAQPQNAD